MEALEEGKTGEGHQERGLPGAICRRSTATCNLDGTRKAQMRDVETLPKGPFLGSIGEPPIRQNPTGGPLGDPQLAVWPVSLGLASCPGLVHLFFRPLPLPTALHSAQHT